VLTTGFLLKKVKVEGSLFNGREPGEDRYTLDFGPLDSWSGRIAYLPARNWALDYSYGFLRKPEALEDTNINRQGAELQYNKPFHDGHWSSSLIWGRNNETAQSLILNSYALESTVNFLQKNYVYTRIENVDKNELFDNEAEPPPQFAGKVFRIAAYTLGGVRDVVHNEKLQLGLGADVTFYGKAAILDSVYGDFPVSYRLFIRIRPGEMKHMH